jgi:hypothetical protein
VAIYLSVIFLVLGVGADAMNVSVKNSEWKASHISFFVSTNAVLG